MSKVLAMDPTVELFWIPDCDKDEEVKLKIKFHYLTARDEAKINDQMIETMTKGKTSKNKYLISTADLKRCELSIIDWENFLYGEDHPTLAGKPVPFSTMNIGLLPPNIRSEFTSFLTKKDEIDDEEDDTDLGEAKE